MSQLGIRISITHQRNATDLVGNGTASNLTLDQESTTVVGSITHRITPRVTGSLLGQYQHSVFNGGALDSKVNQFVTIGLSLQYRINQYWSTDLGYNFDHLDSDVVDTSFTRNRVYAGVTASF